MVNNDKIIYFDNAATSFPKPKEMIEGMRRFNDEIGANPGRSGHKLSVEAGRIMYEAREAVAGIIGVTDPLRIAFTKNASEALNIAISSVLEPGDNVVVTSMEHNSVARPLRYFEDQGVSLTIVGGDETSGFVSADQFADSIKPETKLLICLHASNVTGVVNPIAEIGTTAREHGILFLVDAAQTAGYLPIDVEGMKIDFLAFTGHKSLLGPQGTGGLYVRPGLKVKPLMRGGTGSRSEEDTHPEFMPDLLECGTPNCLGLAGLKESIAFIEKKGMEKLAGHKRNLTNKLAEGLMKIPHIKVLGPPAEQERCGIISVVSDTKLPSELAQILDERFGIATRVGLHCAPWAHKTIGTYPGGTLRFSAGPFNNEEQVDNALRSMEMIVSG